MASSKEQRAEIIKEYGKNPQDSGSPEVQIALLTDRLGYLNGHFKTHKKDHHSRRGLLRIVSQRKRLLIYLQRINLSKFREIKAKLGIR